MNTQRKVHWIQVKIAFREGMDPAVVRADDDGIWLTTDEGVHPMRCGRLDELRERIGGQAVTALANLQYHLLAVPVAESGAQLPDNPRGNPLATRMVEGESVEMMTTSPDYRIWLYRIDPAEVSAEDGGR